MPEAQGQGKGKKKKNKRKKKNADSVDDAAVAGALRSRGAAMVMARDEDALADGTDDGAMDAFEAKHRSWQDLYGEETGYAGSTAPFDAALPGTLPVLNAARLAIFIATGASKAAPLKEAFAPDTEMPAGLVLARRTHWLVDRPAAAQLQEQAAAADHLYG